MAASQQENVRFQFVLTGGGATRPPPGDGGTKELHGDPAISKRD